MKSLKILLVVTAIFCVSALFAENVKVIFNVNMHCEACQKKIEKNIAFEKGVKALEVDLKTNQVTVTYDDKKTNVEKLQQGFKKIGYEATIPVVSQGCKPECKQECKGNKNVSTDKKCCSDTVQAEKKCCTGEKPNVAGKKCCSESASTDKKCCSGEKANNTDKKCCSDTLQTDKKCCSDKTLASTDKKCCSQTGKPCEKNTSDDKTKSCCNAENGKTTEKKCCSESK